MRSTARSTACSSWEGGAALATRVRWTGSGSTSGIAAGASSRRRCSLDQGVRVVVGLNDSTQGEPCLAALARRARPPAGRGYAGGRVDHSGEEPPSWANAKPPMKTGPAAGGLSGSSAGSSASAPVPARARGWPRSANAPARAPRSSPPRRGPARAKPSLSGCSRHAKRSSVRRALRTAALRSSPAGIGTVIAASVPGAAPPRLRRSRRDALVEPLGGAAPDEREAVIGACNTKRHHPTAWRNTAR